MNNHYWLDREFETAEAAEQYAMHKCRGKKYVIIPVGD